MCIRTLTRAGDEGSRPFGLGRWCLLALAVLLSSAGCYRFASVEPLATPTHEEDPRVVRAAVVRALAHQRFDPVLEQPGRVYASLSNRKWTIRIAVDYAPWNYAIHYVDTWGLPVRTGRDGQPRVHRRYHQTIESLRQQIHRELGAPPPAGLESMGPPGTTTVTTTTRVTPSSDASIESSGEVVVDLPAR